MAQPLCPADLVTGSPPAAFEILGHWLGWGRKGRWAGVQLGWSLRGGLGLVLLSLRSPRAAWEPGSSTDELVLEELGRPGACPVAC